MSEQPKFVNLLLSDRSHLTPQESMKTIQKYALMQDARTRSRRYSAAKANWLAAILVFGYPAYYIIKGTFDGCWTALHPDIKFGFTFGAVGKSTRLMYRPEIYYRDQQSYMYEIEKENIAKEKAGEKPTVTSPVVLWH